MDNEKSVFGAILAGGFGFWLLAGGGISTLEAYAVQLGLGMGERPAPTRAADSTPDDMVAFHSDQWGTKGHVAVAAGPTHFWVEDALTGYAPSDPAGSFVLGDAIHPNPTCAVSGYDGAARLQPVYATQSDHDVPLSRQHMDTLRRASSDLIAQYRRSGYRAIDTGPGLGLEVVDVVVPAGDPVHLALMSSKAGLVWSFHVEQGAQIAGVTLIGGNEGGVLNLPDGVPVEAVTAQTLDACDLTVMVQDYMQIGPEGRIGATQIDPNAAATPPRDMPTTIAELEAAVADARPSSFRLWKTSFELWFSRQFGQNPRTNIAGYGDVQVVVAGPMPAASVAWTPPEGGTLRLINGPIYLVGTSQVRSDAWRGLVMQFAERSLGHALELEHPDHQPEPQADG